MMKTIAYLPPLLPRRAMLAAAFMFVLALFASSGTLRAQTITVTSPVAGNSYPSCQPITITWNYNGLGSNAFRIQYSYDNFQSVYNAYPTNYTAAGSPASVTWTPPNLSTTHYNASNLKVRVQELGNPSVFGATGAFTVTQNLSIVTPNGWENFTPGTIQTITFPNSGTSGSFNLQYCLDRGGNYQTIASNYNTASGFYNWLVPNVNSRTCRLRIFDAANTCFYDASDTIFTIGTPTLSISGQQQFCAPGGTGMYYIPAESNSIVTWSATNGNVTPAWHGAVNVQWTSLPGTLICSETINGLTLSDTITVTNNSAFSIGFAPYTSPVCDPDIITLQINAMGGTPPFNYAWGGGISTFSTAVLSGPGTYNANVTVTDANGCTSTTQTVAVINPSPTVYLGNDTLLCPGTTVVLDAGPGQSMYLWNNGATTQSITAFTAGLYAVTVYNAQGCTATDTVIVNQHPTLTLLPADTILCADTSITLSVSPSFSNILWSTNATTPAITVSLGGSYYLDVVDNNGCIQSDTVHITSLPDCVFPGDADYDAVADNNDVLAMGLAFGASGGTRPGATTQWYGQAAPNWATSLPGGANHKHSDADGNGLVDANDTLAITLNYGRTHNKTGGTTTGTFSLVVDALEDSVQAGDTAVFQLLLGAPSVPADSIFGLAFTVNYDTSVVDSQGIIFNTYQNCWFAPAGDRLPFTMDLYPEPKADMAVTRTSATDTMGHGEVCRFGVVTIDNISGKRSTLARPLHVWLSDVRIITAGNKVLSATLVGDSTVVSDEASGLPSHPAVQSTWQLAPNPAKGVVELRGEAPLESLRVIDLQGRVLAEWNDITTRTHSLPLGGLPAGVYMVEASPGGLKSMKKLVVMD